MMKYNEKQVILEINRERYSKRIHELINRHYKNFDDLIKSNSKLENFMKKFNNILRSENSQDKMYTFQLINKTEKEFKNKCTLLFSDINSVLDISSSRF